jgi:hypothetical protein
MPKGLSISKRRKFAYIFQVGSHCSCFVCLFWNIQRQRSFIDIDEICIIIPAWYFTLRIDSTTTRIEMCTRKRLFSNYSSKGCATHCIWSVVEALRCHFAWTMPPNILKMTVLLIMHEIAKLQTVAELPGCHCKSMGCTNNIQAVAIFFR